MRRVTDLASPVGLMTPGEDDPRPGTGAGGPGPGLTAGRLW